MATGFSPEFLRDFPLSATILYLSEIRCLPASALRPGRPTIYLWLSNTLTVRYGAFSFIPSR